jgi:phosphoribosylanthranilate isomerase
MTPVKICGITRIADARVAAQLGAHAIGFVFYGGSKRNVEPARTAEIIRALPPFVTTVGLFVNPAAEDVRHVLAEARLDLLQFHGDETPQFCRSFGTPYLKALRVRAESDLLQYAQLYGDARGLLLDTYVADTHGGTAPLSTGV